jgi:hypothetical protein
VALLREPFGRPLRPPPEGCTNDLSPHIGFAPAAGSTSSMVAPPRLATLPAAAGCLMPQPRPPTAWGGNGLQRRSGLARTATIRSSRARHSYHLQN